MSEPDPDSRGMEARLDAIERHYVDQIDAAWIQAIKARIRIHLMSGLDPDFTALLIELRSDYPDVGPELVSLIVHETVSHVAETCDEYAPIRASRPFTPDEDREGARLKSMTQELERFVKLMYAPGHNCH